jgi:glycosyltransferase involved in cell wall biosynthesis
MKTILFLSKGATSASTRYRALQYFSQLSAAGFVAKHAVVGGGAFAYTRALYQAASADIVVVLRKMLPAPHLWLLRKISRRLVFDFDDAIFCNSDGSPSTTRMQRFIATVALCDHILAGNHFLAAHAAHHNPAVTIAPTCIDPARYAAAPADKPAGNIDLVWIGSSSTRKYLVEALPALRLAAKRVPNLRLKIIADFDLPGAGIETLAVPWSASIESAALSSSHIGIAPMHDDDWSRGKCALKVLQYMACGLPVISSNVGTNAEVIAHGHSGYLVSNDEDWADSIEKLAGNSALRNRFGIEGKRKVLSDYSIAPVATRITDVFESLLQRP